MGKSAILLAICLALAPGAARAVAPGEDGDLNNGEDFTRPPARFSLRYRFEDEGDGVTQNTFILRRDQPTPLADDWELGTRLDLPLVQTDKKSADNPQGNGAFGLGDLLAQATLIHDFTDRFAFGGGARFIFPTAGEDQLGAGKYRLLPILGARWSLPEISAGSFVQWVARYDFDLGGYGGRSHISRLQFGPTLNVALPNRWFLTLNPSQDFAVNFLGGAKWFVPADFALGRNLSDRTVASVEVSVPLLKQYVAYDCKVEARLGFSF